MGVFKCNVGFVWSLVLAVVLTVIPRYWESKVESASHLMQAIDATPKTEVVNDRIQKNTTLVATLVDYDIPVTMANEVAGSIRPVFDPRKLRFGNPFRLEKDPDGTLRAFEYTIDDENILKVQKEEDSYAAKVEQLEFEMREQTIATEIRTSLWDALSNEPKGESLTMNLAEIFQWQVDFTSEIQTGDRIRLVVEKQYHDGNFVKYGKVRAAELRNAGHTYQAFLFQDSYYDEKAVPLKRAILASPLKFTPRVSSGFRYRRMHPILGIARAHLATDYAAPSGSPVVSVAKGVVTFAGRSGGYGNLVKIRHANGLTTGYAHLSRIARGIRAGRSVSQGELIGLVGQTGLATGPHLHFMMIKNGTPINPIPALKKGEPSPPIKGDLRAKFLEEISPLRLKLGELLASK